MRHALLAEGESAQLSPIGQPLHSLGAGVQSTTLAPFAAPRARLHFQVRHLRRHRWRAEVIAISRLDRRATGADECARGIARTRSHLLVRAAACHGNVLGELANRC